MILFPRPIHETTVTSSNHCYCCSSAFTMAWSFSDSNFETASTMKSSAALVGHLTLTATDEAGEVIAYRQLDNVVVNDGDDCILEYITEASVSGCAATADFQWIHIGTGGDNSVGETDANLTTWFAVSESTAGSPTAASGTDTAAAVTISTTFDNVSESIDEAAIRNGAASDTTADTLALQEFTAIPLGSTDDLTIQWTISVDGS